MWTFKVEHKSSLEFKKGEKVILKQYPRIPMKVMYPYCGAVLCQIFGEYGDVGYRVFEVSQLVRSEVASLVRQKGLEICLN